MRALGGALSARQPPAVNVQVNVVNKDNQVHVVHKELQVQTELQVQMDQ